MREERKWHEKKGRREGGRKEGRKGGRVLLKGHSFAICGCSFGDT